MSTKNGVWHDAKLDPPEITERDDFWRRVYSKPVLVAVRCPDDSRYVTVAQAIKERQAGGFIKLKWIGKFLEIYEYGEDFHIAYERMPSHSDVVTHWMPLPDLPKE